jgi:hypothetical protein
VPPSADEVIFLAPPGAGAAVMIRYTRQTWTDNELEGYLEEARSEYVQTRHVVYRAGILALDTMAPGLAIAFDFGAGEETFSYTKAFDNLMTLRDKWEQWLEQNVEEGRLYIEDVVVDSIEPGDIRDDPAQWPWTGSAGYFPSSARDNRGGLD